ncbi:CheR family methyltransferase [Aliamphritea spongicola]|uniref:CheR family methyltransferase n=1 Tax=Aliamphritea spongicola TaxID=707589 RepID=UPI00196B4E17|nr:protein-glutamate O-methyltransferase CheR [Aliamphritea spongicola]MBN3564071.1 protein-glutamate O-methyltransferase CheR [Aliamphritea spongicola]
MATTTATEREFVFTDKHFTKAKQELYDYAGIALADHKQDMVYNRLVRRLRELGLDSFDEYFRCLDSSPAEFTQFINALTTNLTAFFRERHHFDYVKSQIVPAIKNSPGARLRIWSAGCSLGEEPYSLAISLLEAGIDPSSCDVKILATDIDSKVLASARTGVYEQSRVKSLPKATVHKWFLKGKNHNDGRVKVRPELQKMVAFNHLNLMDDWPMKGPFDFIFCRNVMIYFDQQTQARLLQRMAALLKPRGHLFVGHSEALARHQSNFELMGKTIYRKVN